MRPVVQRPLPATAPTAPSAPLGRRSTSARHVTEGPQGATGQACRGQPLCWSLWPILPLLKAVRLSAAVRRTKMTLTGSAAIYSITSSANASNAGGMVRPSALADLRLTTNSIFENCCTGRSPGFSPLSMRPV
jgi:hypothetical protein